METPNVRGSNGVRCSYAIPFKKEAPVPDNQSNPQMTLLVSPSATFSARRRGTVLVALVLVLLMLGLVTSSMIFSGARDQSLAALRIQRARADFAVEAVANMAAKELMDNVDRDSDGGIGSISADSNTATDPTINDGTRMWATKVETASTVTVTAYASNGDSTSQRTLVFKK
jgi:hypothetical protein